MPTDIKIIHAQDFIRATADGDLDFAAAKKLLVDIASAATPLTDFEIILDTRKTESRLSAVDLWYLAAELRNPRGPFPRKTAVLCPLEDFDSAAFFALCAENQGFQIKAFTSFEEAVGWLVADEM